MPAKPRAASSQSRITKSKHKETSKKPSAQKILSAVAASTGPTTSTSSTIPDGKEQKKNGGPVYFWRPHEGNGYLGQWFPTPFDVDNETYATAEMWMMVQKARLFKDEDIAKKMLATTDPKTHKTLGRKVANFDEATWNEQKLAIVTEGNYHKFMISEDAEKLRGLLLATGNRELVEASPMDRVWGIGFTEKNAGRSRQKWGQNLLGKALVSVRERLREEGEKKEEMESVS